MHLGVYMRIISWNCDRAFNAKCDRFIGFSEEVRNADIYVIQECGNPISYNNLGKSIFACNYIWIENKNGRNGLGVFAKPGISLSLLHWSNPTKSLFVPVQVNNNLVLLAVWTHLPYSESFRDYYGANCEKFNDNMVIIGDFNSNTFYSDGKPNTIFESIVRTLEKKGFYSAYHYQTREQHCQETVATHYTKRSGKVRPVHIDHCFISKNIVENNEIYYKVLGENDKQRDYWLDTCQSDHIPLLLNIH